MKLLLQRTLADSVEGPFWLQSAILDQKLYYSVPYPFVQQEVWLKAGLRVVEIYDLNFRPLTMHAVTTRPGQYRTNPDHYPPEKRDAMALNGEACLRIAAEIGCQVGRFVDILLSDECWRGSALLRG